MRVLVADPIAAEGISLLRASGIEVDIKTGLPSKELEAIINGYDGLIVRSETQVTEAVLTAGKALQVVGRAGVGVDNINVEAATRGGVLVVNAPTANTVAAAEHTVALMLALARHVAQANASLKSGKWDRKSFMGTQLRGKTLGIIGLGKVGSEVARRARSFEMRLIGMDPFVSKEFAQSLGVEIADKDQILRESDFLTLHVPMTASTKALLTAEDLAKAKPGLRIINAARGGLIDEQALFDAVQSGKIAGAAVDVFTVEPAKDNPLFKSDKIIVTPHLGASTAEAQTQVAIEVVEQVLDVLRGRPARYAVNAPMLLPEALAVLAPFVDVGVFIGSVATQLTQGQMQSIVIRYAGDIAQHDTALLKAAVIRGLLGPVSDERVNVVNAGLVAEQRGLRITEIKEAASEVYRNLLSVELSTDSGKTVIAGTHNLGSVHIVQVNDYRIDVVASDGHMLFIENQDRPGMVGKVGTIAGESDVNISFMEVGRLTRRGQAMMVLGIDEAMPEAAVKRLLQIPGILSVRQAEV
ncbi:MAG: phosphoglycerate dehydrogenase [Dehalococcoidia bacterium]|nr:phosphoglycerate dehydrogenase [Dehalococcoidia bacterium]